MVPTRFVTATSTGIFTEFTAAWMMAWTSDACSRGSCCTGAGSLPVLMLDPLPLPPQEVNSRKVADNIVNRQKNWTGLFICAIMQNLEAASTSIAGHSGSALTPSLDLL